MEYKYRLPRAFAEKWIAALESGKYAQGKDALCVGDAYCCLGVACAIQAPRFLQRSQQWIPEAASEEGIPEEICDSKDLPVILARMNDAEASFSDITQWIKANVELYDETSK